MSENAGKSGQGKDDGTYLTSKDSSQNLGSSEATSTEGKGFAIRRQSAVQTKIRLVDLEEKVENDRVKDLED